MRENDLNEVIKIRDRVRELYDSAGNARESYLLAIIISIASNLHHMIRYECGNIELVKGQLSGLMQAYDILTRK